MSKEKIEKLIEKIEISNQSIDWWENEINKITRELDELAKKPTKKNLLKEEKLLLKLIALISRGKVELKTIDQLEIELQNLIRDEKEKEKSGNED